MLHGKVAYNVPKGILSFALKASTNCLSTPDNLKLWGMKQLADCALCKNYCTLLHILNYCKVSLVQGRFTWRHNSVLNYLISVLKPVKSATLEIWADIPGLTLNGSTVPPDILCTAQRPDVVIVDRESKRIALLELTCSFESNAEAANSRKTLSYKDMKTDLEESGYKVFLIPFEIGSRGFINKRNRTAITQILKEFSLKVNTKQLYINMSKIALLCSFTIFQAQAQPTWQDPPFLKP